MGTEVTSGGSAAKGRQHAKTGAPTAEMPEPSHAERVRTLLAMADVGTLSTVSRRQAGFPFGSLMPYALDDAGRPIFLISNMAMHTQNLRADPRASLFVAQAAVEGDPLGSARATLVGRAEPVPAEQTAAVREVYLRAHESSGYWVDFADFGFFRLQPMEVYYVGGFGVMGWVGPEDYSAAAPDPLASAAAAILSHMNADHGEALLLLARAHAGLEGTAATMLSVDRLGFQVKVTTAEGVKAARISFPREVRSPGETREVLVAMVNEARAQG